MNTTIFRSRFPKQVLQIGSGADAVAVKRVPLGDRKGQRGREAQTEVPLDSLRRNIEL